MKFNQGFMMNTVFTNNVAWGWHLHLILGGALFLGVVFLVIWAVRFMSKKDLTNWTLWLIVVGIVGVLLTASWGFSGWKQMMRLNNGWDFENVNWESMMGDIKEEDYKDLDTREEWGDFMLKEMEEHMGFGEAPGASEASTSTVAQPEVDPEETGIKIASPQANSVISFPLTITGEARGTWYFEATFTVKLLDSDGTVLAETYAQALDDWMQEGFVAFEAKIEDADPNTSNGKLVFEKVNMSGLPENDFSVEVPVKF